MIEPNEENVFYISIQEESERLKFKEAIEKYLSLAYKDGALLKDDLFILPTINFAMELLDNIENCYFQKQFIACAIAVRSLLDATMSMIYFLTVPKEDYDEFFEEYLKSGELTTKSKNGNRKRITGKELCQKFKKIVEYDVNDQYKKLSKYVHPTIEHFYAIYKDKGDGKFEMPVLGSRTNFLEENYKELYQIIYTCMDVLILILLQRNG